MKSGVHDFSVTLSSRLISMVVGLATQSCLAWVLGPADRGSYAVCLLFATLLRIIFVVGCDIATVYSVSSKRFSISEGIVYSLIYGGIGSLVAMGAGLFIMQLPLSFLDKATPTAFYLALASIPVGLFSYTFQQLLTAVQQFNWFGIALVINSSSILILTMIFVWALSWGVAGAFLAIIAGSLLSIVNVLVFLRWKYAIARVKVSWKKLSEMFHYGIRYHLGKISNQMNLQVGTVVLAMFAKTDEIGLFAVAAQLAVQTMVIPDTLITILIPRVAGDKDGKKYLISQCFRLTGMIYGLLMVILAVFARPIVAVVFSPAFLPIVPLVRILTIGVVIRSCGKVLVPYFLGTNHPGMSSISVAIGAIVNLAVLWLLLPMMGLSAAAIAMVLGFFASSMLLIVAFIRFSGLGAREAWLPKRADWDVVANAVSRVYSRVFA